MNRDDRPLRVGWLALALICLASATVMADDDSPEMILRLTIEQMQRLGQEVTPRQAEALERFKAGKPAEAIPIVEKYLATQRAVLSQASSNEPERQLTAAEIKSRANDFARLGVPSFPRQNRTSWRELQIEVLETLDLLASLYEVTGDLKRALERAREVEAITARLSGVDNWRTKARHQGTTRLEQLAALDADQLKLVENGKQATVLLVNQRTALGTAFCVDPRGLYLTSSEYLTGQSAVSRTTFDYSGKAGQLARSRTVESEQQLPLFVILNIGRAGQKVLAARVLRVGKSSAMALLKVESETPLPSLELASSGAGVERGQKAMVFGLPAVYATKPGQATPSPTVEPIPAQVVAARKQAGKAWIDQLDVVPAQGYTGGPVVDEQGRVIGSIVTGLAGTDVSYVIPVDRFDELVGSSLAVCEPPAIDYEARKNRVEWPIQVYSRSPVPTTTSVEILVGASRRRFVAEAKGDGKFVASVVPVAGDDLDRVELTFDPRPASSNPKPPIGDGRAHSVTVKPGQVTTSFVPDPSQGPTGPKVVLDDRTIKIGGVSFRLTDLRRIELGPIPRGLTVDGRRLSGAVEGLDDIQVSGLKWTEFPALTLRSPPESIDPVEIEVVVKQDEKVVDRHLRKVEVRERPVRVEGTLDLSRIGPMSSARSIHPPPIEIPPARADREPDLVLHEGLIFLENAHHYSAAFSNNGRRFASGGDDDRIKVYEASSGQMYRLIAQDSWVQSIDFTPDDLRLLTAGYHKRLHLWDLASSKDVGKFEDADERDLDRSKLSPDGLLALAAYAGGKRLILWDVETGKKLRALPEAAELHGFNFTPDSRQILLARRVETGCEVQLVDAKGGEISWTASTEVKAVVVGCWCPKGSSEAIVAFADGTIERRNRLDGKLVRPASKILAIRDGCACVSPDGRRLLTGHDDKTVRCWDLDTLSERSRFATADIPTGAPAIAPDGRSAIVHSFRKVIHPLRLREPALEDSRVLLRPSAKFQDVVIAGGGRYLLLVMKDAKKLAIFDASAGAIVKELELASADVLVAAGAGKAILAYPATRTLERLDLAKLEVDHSAALPFNGMLKSISMGSDSVGPIVASWTLSVERQMAEAHLAGFLDPETFKIVWFKTGLGPKGPSERINLLEGWDASKGGGFSGPPFFRTSSGGDLAVSERPTMVLELGDGIARLKPVMGSPWNLVPGPEGRTIFLGQGPVPYDEPGKPLASAPGSEPRTFLTSDPAYYFTVAFVPPQSTRPPDEVRVHSTVSTRPLFAINGLNEMAGAGSVGGPINSFSAEKRYHLIPAARLLVTIPRSNDCLYLRKLDLAETLDRLAPDELVVTSPPLVTTQAGTAFRHRFEARSKHGPITFGLIQDVEGITLSDQGELSWEVPPTMAGREAVVKVRLGDSREQTLIHSLRILVHRGSERGL